MIKNISCMQELPPWSACAWHTALLDASCKDFDELRLCTGPTAPACRVKHPVPTRHGEPRHLSCGTRGLMLLCIAACCNLCRKLLEAPPEWTHQALFAGRTVAAAAPAVALQCRKANTMPLLLEEMGRRSTRIGELPSSNNLLFLLLTRSAGRPQKEL